MKDLDLEILLDQIQKLESRIAELKDQMGSVRRTLYGVPKGDAGDREFTKRVNPGVAPGIMAEEPDYCRPHHFDHSEGEGRPTE